MTTATPTSNKLHLVRVFDVREFDYLRNEYLPLVSGCGNICARCGKEHARVYVLSNGDMVGVKCCGKELSGEAKKLEQAMKDTQRIEAKRRMREFMNNAVAQMVREAQYINRTQGYVTEKQLNEIATKLVSHFSGNKQEQLMDRVWRKSMESCGPLRVKNA